MLKVLQHSVFKVPQDGQMLFAELRQLPVRLPPLSLNELPFDEWRGALLVWPGDVNNDGIMGIGPTLEDLALVRPILPNKDRVVMATQNERESKPEVGQVDVPLGANSKGSIIQLKVCSQLKIHKWAMEIRNSNSECL